MTRRRFHAPSSQIDTNKNILELNVEETRHLRDVLRLRPGGEAFVFDGEGREFQCVIDNVGKHSAVLRIVSEVPPARSESQTSLTLAIAILKGEKLDLVVQKATELGVNRLLLITCVNADVKIKHGEESQKRLTRLRRLSLEAAKQSGRAVVPIVDGPVDYDASLVMFPGDLKFCFSERSGNPLPRVQANAPVQRVTALIGPEGGLTDDEISNATRAGWTIVTLGGRVMRAETAAIAVTAILQNLYGDLR